LEEWLRYIPNHFYTQWTSQVLLFLKQRLLPLMMVLWGLWQLYHSEFVDEVADMLLGVLEWCKKNLCPAWLTDWAEYVLAMPIRMLADWAEKVVQWGAVPIGWLMLLVDRMLSWFHPVYLLLSHVLGPLYRMVMEILRTLKRIGSKPFQWAKRIGSKPFQWVKRIGSRLYSSALWVWGKLKWVGGWVGARTPDPWGQVQAVVNLPHRMFLFVTSFPGKVVVQIRWLRKEGCCRGKKAVAEGSQGQATPDEQDHRKSS
jgi:hypothetical protein